MRDKLDVIMDEIIERHKRNRRSNSEFGSEDLVDVFLRVQEEGNLKYPITNDSIKAVLKMQDLFIGGTETSLTTIDWAMVELLRRHEAMAKRDPRYWKDPEKFEPERFENSSVDFLGGDHQFLPFGGGKRMCPGMTFGTTTVESVLAQLLYNFDWKLPAGVVRAQDVDMIESNGITAARKDNLFVVATPYK
ncbi:premnaspirodiene oxygenase-like [Salvia splendens]|uniref:premnaspirodiene oxygenase-like n=1 Tax=Salvia splendens TaxID=180675 RepID=UPI001C26188A|nr:premnaspirodiene oxygenase-like [Salvia splendens]